MHLTGPFALGAAMLLAGCMMQGPHDHPWAVIEEHADQETYVLDYTLTNLRAEHRGAEPGPHCGDAWVDEGTIEVQEGSFDAARAAGAFLLVKPLLKGNWSTWGSGAIFRGIPANVDPAVDGNVTPWVRIERDAPGLLRVDGAPVELPHHWSYVDDTQDWRVDARLVRGPSTIVVIEDVECE